MGTSGTTPAFNNALLSTLPWLARNAVAFHYKNIGLRLLKSRGRLVDTQVAGAALFARVGRVKIRLICLDCKGAEGRWPGGKGVFLQLAESAKTGLNWRLDIWERRDVLTAVWCDQGCDLVALRPGKWAEVLNRLPEAQA